MRDRTAARSVGVRAPRAGRIFSPPRAPASRFFTAGTIVVALAGTTATSASAAGVASGQGRTYESSAAGYVDITEHGSLSGVTGTWTVPTLSSAKLGYSSIWVGVNGNSSSSGIEVGTEQDWGPAGLIYYAWYSNGGASPVQLGQVFPGDSVKVTIRMQKAGAWTIAIDDTSSGSAWTGAVASPGHAQAAEWVVQASPAQGGTGQAAPPLANFGTVQFRDLTVNGPGAATARAIGLYMVGQTGGPVEAFPNAYDRQTDSFTVTYGPKTPTPLPVASLSAPSAAPAPVPSPAWPVAPPSTGPGYRLATLDGAVFAYGGEHFSGAASAAEQLAGQDASPGAIAAQLASGRLGGPVAAMATTPDKAGYWLMTETGGIFTFGDAGWYGSLTAMGGGPVPMAAMASTPDGRGYWLVSLTGGVYAFGDARFTGSCTPSTCPFLAVGIVADRTGRGYWVLLQNCEMVPFGDAPHIADTDCETASGTTFTAAVSAVASPDGQGYWTMLGDGTVFAEGDAATYGDWPATAQTVPGDQAVALVPTPDDRGAWQVYASGYVEDLGDAPSLGSLEATVLQAPVVTAGG